MAKELLTKTERKQEIHQIVWQLHQQGLTQEQIGKAVGYTQANVSLILQAIQEVGIENYEVGTPPGASAKLRESEFGRLGKLLLKEAKQNGFATDGWTQKRVQTLIKKEFGVHYTRAYISEILAKLGFTLQVPRLRDIRQDEEKRQEYREKTLPELKKKSAKAGHTLIFVDESSFAMSGNQFTTYAPRGQGVTLERYQSVTERVYSISGITPQGDLHSAVQTRPFCSKHVAKFLKQLLNELKGKIHLVWDNASIHFSELIKTFLKQNRQTERLTLYALPTYSPDFNPDEQVWNHLKNHELIRMEFDHKTKLAKELEIQLQQLKNMPELIRSFFRHPDVGVL